MKIEAVLRPSRMTRSLRVGDAAEGSKALVLARRWVLGRLVEFYRTGEHLFVGKSNLKEDEQYHSELLRFCHTSLVAGAPVGDRKALWVDARQDPVDVVICGLEAREYMRQAKAAVDSEMILDGDAFPALKQWRT